MLARGAIVGHSTPLPPGDGFAKAAPPRPRHVGPYGDVSPETATAKRLLVAENERFWKRHDAAYDLLTRALPILTDYAGGHPEVEKLCREIRALDEPVVDPMPAAQSAADAILKHAFADGYREIEVKWRTP